MLSTVAGSMKGSSRFRLLFGATISLMWLCAETASWAQAPFQPPPACWSQPRIFHSGTPEPELATRVRLVESPISPRLGVATTSPNGAYRFWLEQPDMTSPAPWNGRVVVDTQSAAFPTLLAVDIALPLAPRWLNEKLIFLRIAFGRTVFTDVIWDVETNALVYQEAANDGTAVYAQSQAACSGDCPCDGAAQPAMAGRSAEKAPSSADSDLPAAPDAPRPAGAPAVAVTPVAPPVTRSAAPPAPLKRAPEPAANRVVGTAPAPISEPAADEPIGLLSIPELFGFGQGNPPPRDAAPVTVFASPSAGARTIGEIRRRSDAKFDEVGYEAGAVVVYGIEGEWYEVRLRRDNRRDAFLVGWIPRSPAGRFYANAELLQDRFGYLNAQWDGRMWSAPDASGRLVRSATMARGDDRERAAKIIEARETELGLWVRIALYRNSPCESGDQSVEQEGWVPAYSGKGTRVVWYWSRGC